MKDTFFSQTTCDRCGGSLQSGRTMSMYSTECICIGCKKKERKRDDYAEASRVELEQVKAGNMNFRGIRPHGI